ncbi:MAG TPA: endonuclease/exonuclease/phosphatase family protein [Sphingomicrobium sp.]|nr:endonuclease/exonuclease/phosphatase family protein [Sphingomicrobium sp.]
MSVRATRASAIRLKRRLLGAVALAMLLGSCGTSPPLRTLACNAATPPAITLSADGTKSTTLKVLTYNIEGLGFPARSGRERELRQIGERLFAMRDAGTGPDIILFQEMFSGAAKNAVAATGYPAIASGPDRTTRATGPKPERLPGKSNIRRGEVGMHFAGSGLAIASRYPIVLTDMRAYGARACAGLDCLANKGIMHARIVIPGLPTPIDVYDTHMNSRGASKVSHERNLEAHNRQALEASQFIDATHDDNFPLIFGGDYNMRHSEPRWENFSRYQQLNLVHRVCVDPASGCEVKMSWDGDEPWMDTQDLQFFWNGNPATVRPIRVEAVFDGSPDSPQLSDHDGFLVTYELKWPAAALPAPVC